MKKYYTYITSNPSRTTFYTGITNNLANRLSTHYENRGKPKTFAGRYRCYQLVYYEEYDSPIDAINREKVIKNMLRETKIALIKSLNADFTTLNYIFF